MPTYRFKFDVQGTELEATAEALPVAVAVGNEIAAGDGVDARKVQPAAFLFELLEWLEEHSALGLDLDILERKEVLITPPHWSYVAEALRIVADTGTDRPLTVDQRQAVNRYAAMLRSRQAELDKAIALAGFASSASRSLDPAERMHHALGALPQGADMRVDEIPELANALSVAPSLSEGRARRWAENILERHNHISRLAQSYDWGGLELQSWDEWKRRFAQYRAGRQRFDMNATDLLLTTRWAGPASMFRNQLARMPLRKWTEALLVAVRGQGENSEQPVPHWVRLEVERELFAGRRTLLIVVGQGKNSPTAEWLPSKQNGCLWIERSAWFEYYQTLDMNGGAVYGDAMNLFIAIEVPAGTSELGQVLSQNPEAWLGSPPAIPLGRHVAFAYVGSEVLPMGMTPVVPYLENAKTVDEAVYRLQVVSRPAQ